MLFRLFIQLLLIEGMVFGINLALGYRFSPFLAGIVAMEVAGIFVFVYFVMWLNERRVVREFNRKLARLQEANRDGDAE